MKTALVAGSTGLIGNQLLELLLREDRYEKIIALSRKPLAIQNSKIVNLVVDFDKLNEIKSSLAADDVYCCLGTTIKQVKTKEAFRKVDYEYPLTLATITKEQGANTFLLVSALGANKDSSIFYNTVKGEVEDAISHVDFESLHIFRPSLLIGPRVEHRSGEEAAKVIYKYLNFLIPKKFKGIESIKVARAMIAFAQLNEKGIFFHESTELQAY
jgi:uncharacterized protein YbjT (DUF2867 family)